jgi:hypothetical protein
MGEHLVSLEIVAVILSMMTIILGAKKVRKAVVFSLRSLRNENRLPRK